MAERKGPTDAQLAAAIEGAKNMREASRGAGKVMGPADTPLDPSVETGGPRGGEYPPSRTSGGRITEESGAYGVEPDEFIKRETAVFQPGTGGRKPPADAEADRTPGSAEGE